MPPAMTSARGPVRANSISGMMPRREPLRRLYPLQRSARIQSENIQDNGNTPGDNAGKNANFIDPEAFLKRRALRSGNPIAIPITQHNAEKVSYRYESPDRYLNRGDRQSYPKPLIRRSSDVSSITSLGSSLSYPIHTNSKNNNSVNGSILKHPNTARRSREPFSNPKSVQFCPNVSVVHMDEDGEHVHTHFQELNGEKRKRLGTLTKMTTRDYDNILYINNPEEQVVDKVGGNDHIRSTSESKSLTHGGTVPQNGDRSKRLSSSGSTTISIPPNPSFEQSQENIPLKKGHFNITFTTRAGEGTKLRFILHMGQEYNPNDLVVKANTTGSRIRVLATKNGGNSHVKEEYNERFQLPMDIDPYEIEARLDKWGNLTVEAPLMTVDKRSDLNKLSNSIMSAVYV